MDATSGDLLSYGLGAVAALLSLALLAHIVSYTFDILGLKAYPGPFFAQFSELWIGWNAARGRIVTAVADAHKAYGPVVRIAPNHISIADVSALPIIYGHSAGILKSDFYEVFNSLGSTSVFTTRSREDHARKRKILAHSFAHKTVLEYEPTIQRYLRQFIKQWEHICLAASSGQSGAIGDAAWTSQHGRAVLNSLRWINFVVFDIIGDLLFRAPFGMTERGTDVVVVAKEPDQAIASYNSNAEQKLEYDTVNAVGALSAQVIFFTALGQFPLRWRSVIQRLPVPWIRAGQEGFGAIIRMAVTAVAHRSQHDPLRNNILAKYFDATDDQGEKMHDYELSVEAIGLLIAGSDTTSNSLGALMFYLAQNLSAQAKLQAELDSVLGAPHMPKTEEEPVLGSYEVLKSLPYLQDVVNEGLRLFSIIGLGLPRVVPEGGLTILGRVFAPRTVISVPSYVVHHDKVIWGDDADSFNPDRWAKGDRATLMKAFTPFSIGPRACIGRNLASMELLIFVANVFHRFEVELAYPGQIMEVREGFLQQPLSVAVSLKRRGML